MAADTTTTVRVYMSTSDFIDDYVKEINIERAKKGMMKLTKTHAIDLAVKKLTLKDGLK